MMKTMDTLLAQYEQGTLTRRQLLQGLAVVVAPGERQASGGALRGRNINHVNLRVADVDRSVVIDAIEVDSLEEARRVVGQLAQRAR